MNEDPEVHKRNCRDPETWRTLVSGEACPICISGKPYGIVAELGSTFLTTDEAAPFKFHGQ